MEVSPAKSLILSATIHGGSYFFIQPFFCKPFKINGLQYLISFEIVIFSVLTPI
jgi:hypothetical protein